MGTLEDSLDGIFDALKEGAATMRAGGGVGYDFSTLRPAGERLPAGAIACGPVELLHLWDRMCATVQSTANRRGAMMGALRCDHPDIEAFVDAKRSPGALSRFNLSVLVTDEFMRAVEAGAKWPLVFPAEDAQPRVYATIAARALWDRITRTAYDCAEPGVLFIARMRRTSSRTCASAWATRTAAGSRPATSSIPAR